MSLNSESEILNVKFIKECGKTFCRLLIYCGLKPENGKDGRKYFVGASAMNMHK